jgi:type I restriction enzyme, S subunit
MTFSDIKDIADIIDSLHKTPKYAENGHPMVRVVDVKYGALNLNNTRKVSDEVYTEFSRRYEPEIDDIIITRVGSYGISALVKDINFCLGQNTAAIKPKINKRFLYYALNSPSLKRQIEYSTVGSTQRTLSLKAIGNLKIPRFEEQYEDLIAEVLSCIDDKIENNRRMNETLEDMARVIFKSWFVDFDPVHAKAEGKQPAHMDAETAALFASSFGEDGLPEGWRYTKLEEILDELETGYRPKGGVRGITEGIPSVGAESINGLAHFEMSQLKYVPLDFFKSMKRGHVKDKDVLLYKDGGKPGQFKPKVAMYGRGFPFAEYCINEHVYRIRSIEPFCQSFLYLFLCSDSATIEMKNRSTGAAVPGLNSTALKSVPISLPSDSVANAFLVTVEPYIDKALTNAAECQTLAQLRDTLLPKLMSGEIRVKDAEQEVEAIA